jgi:hypothetical protein
MILRMLIRRRIVVLLFITIPAVFLSIVELTTSDRNLPFQLSSLENNIFIEVSEKQISLLFFAVAITGFLVSFLALNLVQKNNEANRRLIVCGYHPLELLLSNFISLIVIIILIATYVGLFTSLFFEINHLSLLFVGLILTGIVYGCYGILIGSLIKGELEGVLFIVLLVNIDAGWLQNPLFYAEAQNQALIKILPAYFPSQTAITAAFTDYSIMNASINSIFYGSLLLFFSMLIFFNKMKTKK